MIDLMNSGSDSIDLMGGSQNVVMPSNYAITQASIDALNITGDAEVAKVVASELSTFGNSNTLTQIAGAARETRYVDIRDALELPENYANQETLADNVDAARSLIDVNNVEAAKIESARKQQEPTNYLNITSLVSYEKASSDLHKVLKDRQAESNSIANIVEVLAPLSDVIGSIVNKEELKIEESRLFSSTSKIEFNKAFNAMGIEERTKTLQDLTVAINKIAETTYLPLSANDFLTDALDNEYEGSGWMYFDDVTTVLDIATIGFAAKPVKLAKGVLRVFDNNEVKEVLEIKSPDVADAGDTTLKTSNGNIAGAVNPVQGQELLRIASQDDDAARSLFGAGDRVDLYRSKVIPSYTDTGGVRYTHEAAPSMFKEHEQMGYDQMQNVIDNANLSGIQLTEKEIAAQRDKLFTDAFMSQKDGVHLFENATEVVRKDYGFDVVATYGSSSVKGFKDPADAFKDTLDATAHLGIDVEDIVIKVKLDNNQIVQTTFEDAMRMKAANGDKLEFFAQVSFKKYFDASTVEGVVKDKETLSTKVGSWFNKFGMAGRYFMNPVNKEEKLITATINAMNDRGAAISGGLLDIVAPFQKLSSESKFKVVNLLREGDSYKKADGTEGKKFTYSELQQKVTNGELTVDEAKAVLSNYRFWDTIYILDNRTEARRLSSEGYSVAKIRHDDGSNSTLFGKVVKDSEGADALDLSSNSKAVVKDGDVVLKLDSPVKGADGAYHNIVILPKTQSRLRAISPTDTVLEYREGYYPRKYRGDYYVDRIVRDEKGNVISKRAVANFESSAEAARYAAKRGGDTRVEYVARASKELQEARNPFATEFATDLFTDVMSGRSSQRYRGERLVTDADVYTGVAPTLDPIETMMNAVFNTGRSALHLEALGTLETRFVKEFGHMLENKGSYPNARPNFVSGSEADKLRANALYDYIELQKKVTDDYISKKIIKGVLSNMAEMMDKSPVVGSQTLSKILRGASDIDVASASRQVGFLASMVGHPFRQAILQTAGLLTLVPLTLKYANPVRLLGDTFALKGLVASSVDSKAYAKGIKTLANSLGITEAEAKLIGDNFLKSGLPYTIDANSLVDGFKRGLGGEVYDSLLKTKASAAIDAAKAPLRLAKKYGFDWGEMNNLTGTYLVALERYTKTTGKSVSKLSGREWQEVADSARRLSLNMTRVDNFEYQKGLLSVPLQFTQAFHKYLNLVTLGNRELTAAERARVVGVNAFLWTGIFASVYDEVFLDGDENMPEPVRETLKRGFATYAFNSIVNGGYEYITGEEGTTSVDLSALYMGNPATVVAEAFMNGLSYDTLLEAPSLQSMVRGLGGLSQAYSLATMDFGADVSTMDKFVPAILSGGSFFAGLNEAQKAHIAFNLEKSIILNNKGQAIMEVNPFELGLKTILGIPTTELSDYYGVLEKKYGNSKMKDNDAKDLASHFYSIYVKVASGEEPKTKLDVMQAVIKSISENSPDDALLVKKSFYDLLTRASVDKETSLLTQTMRTPYISKEERKAVYDYIMRNPSLAEKFGSIVQQYKD